MGRLGKTVSAAYFRAVTNSCGVDSCGAEIMAARRCARSGVGKSLAPSAWTAAMALFCFCGSAFAEMETPDALLAREADYCVIANGTGNGLVVRWWIFGDARWQQLRADGHPKLARGKQVILYLSQNYDSIGSCALREIRGDEVEAVSSADWPPNFRASLPPEVANAEVLPKQLKDYVRAVQQIAAKARAERRKRSEETVASMLTRQSPDQVTEYQRINGLTNQILMNLHADDSETLAVMTRFVLEHPEPLFSHVRGQFAGSIAAKYFRPGFDAVRAEAFRNSAETWSSEQEALGGLSRIGDEPDLLKLRGEAEAIIAVGTHRQISGDLFRAMGELAARCFPSGSRKRDEWRKYFERFCASPTAREKEIGCQGMAAFALHYIGNAETKALLQSLKADTNLTSGYRWAIENIDARLLQER